jgi:16S rRNA (guanine527-N7)-methyltransferase
MTGVSAEWLAARLAEPARAVGVTLPPSALEPLAVYASLVLEWGTRFNLTGARDAESVADDHLADALALLPQLPPRAFRFVDVGSGAGFPGIALALLRSDAAGVLLEPTRKKHAFLAHAIRALGLTGRLDARAERLEEHLLAGGRGAYEVAISRAVWPAAEWLARGAALVRPDGLLVGVEGAAPDELPPGAERHPYQLGGRTRAVVTQRA